MTYWKCNSLKLFSAQSMQMSYGIALFYIIQHVLFVPCLLQCIYVYVCISVSLSLTFSSLWKFLWVYFSLCYFPLIFHLTHPSFFSLWISLTCSLSPGFVFQLPLLFQLGKIYTVWYTVLYLTSSVNTANSVISCISNCSLVKEHKSPPSNPPSLRFYEKDTVGWQQQC